MESDIAELEAGLSAEAKEIAGFLAYANLFWWLEPSDVDDYVRAALEDRRKHGTPLSKALGKQMVEMKNSALSARKGKINDR